MLITANHFYNYIQCPHRIWRDLYGPKEEKDPKTNPFVTLLWEKGALHEKNVVKRIGNFLDLSEGSHKTRFEKTILAMQNKVGLIYQGVLIYENCLGIPDMLRHNDDGTYTPIDIKSGRSFENSENEKQEKYKKHYAIQLCHYTKLLKSLGFANNYTGIIIDIHEKETMYDLTKQISARRRISWTQLYHTTKNEVESLLKNDIQNKPAMSGVCKLCPWYKSCKKWAKENEDLTNVFCLGRSKRDILNKDLGIEKTKDIINIDIEKVLKKKDINPYFLRGIAKTTLKKIVCRADLLNKKGNPVLYKKIDFPKSEYELFFDIEDDPTQELVYLHGVYERSKGKERFVPFIAKSSDPKAERKAWAEFWKYINSLPNNGYTVYYYAPHEKTTYKKLRELYPDVISEEELEKFFNKDTAIDLYTDVIYKYTDWPLSNYSLKDIAQYLCFKWRDESPSGALSIQWYNDYIKTKDTKILNRILEYNEDDCKATMVIKDYISNLSF
ncbi:MAG: TM0106 family RecB-like putative nuclease [bacterium]